LLQELLTDYTLRNVALGSAILGAVSGVLGSFAVLRRQALMGDALSHAALPGVCLAYIWTGLKSPSVLMLGAAIAGWLGMCLVLSVTRTTKLDQNSALGIVLSVFFGFGVVLLTVIQKGDDANQAGIDKFLFGQAAALTHTHVVTMFVLSVAAIAVVFALFNQFKLVTFDEVFAKSIGVNTSLISYALVALLMVAIVVGLNTVGVVLMSALVVGPGVAARQWTNSLGKMIVLAALLGATSGVAGAIISVNDARTPTGPVIVLVLSAIVAFSLLFGSARGMVWRAGSKRRAGDTDPVGRQA
jgi:manganese/zinc/iron transport system permease protein